MRKLIEKQQDSLVVCDNPACDYEVPYLQENKNDLRLYLNKPCPKCGWNLLTEKDLLSSEKLDRYVDFINKWFSWITIFYSKKAKTSSMRVHIHNGIKVEK